MDKDFVTLEGGIIPTTGITVSKKPISTILIGKDVRLEIDVDKKFNWFQKLMLKWCFGFKVKENK